MADINDLVMISKSTIKYIQSLQHKKFRDEHNVFLAEGPKVVSELLQTNAFSCKALYAIDGWMQRLDKNMVDLIRDRAEIIKDFELEKIASYATANQVVAVFEKRKEDEQISLQNKLTLVLDDVRDPGNLGTIIRTADWFGINHVICSKNTVDIYNPKVVQSTMASLGRVNVLYADLKQWLAEAGKVKKIAATPAGRAPVIISPVQEAILILGNESKGISGAVLAFADEEITIPKTGEAESLNVAIAAGILMYAMRAFNK